MRSNGLERIISCIQLRKMGTSLRASLFIAFSLLHSSIISTTTHATSFNESCAKGDAPCPALLAYKLTDPKSLQTISALFSVDPSQILAANGFSPRSPPNTTLFRDEIIKIPVPCSCVGNVRRGDSAVYTVVQDDTLSHIAEVTYGGLVTYQEIGAANSIPDLDKITVGQLLVIPYPCSCHANKFMGGPAFYLSYVVRPGQSISDFSQEFGVGVKDLQSLNSLNGTELEANVAIQIPIPACKANFTRGAEDANLTVAAGAYATTANGCVQCSCGQNGTELYCIKAPSASSSCALKCNSSSLEIGNFTKKTSSSGCTIDSCLYDGFTSKTIFTTLHKNTTAAQCPAVEAPPTYAYAPEEQGVPEALGNAPSPTSGAGSGSGSNPGTGTGPGTSAASAPPPASSAQGLLHASSSIAALTVLFVVLLAA